MSRKKKKDKTRAVQTEEEQNTEKISKQLSLSTKIFQFFHYPEPDQKNESKK